MLFISLSHACGTLWIPGAEPLENSFGLFLVQCVIILTICRVLGLAGSYFKLPKVIFEIVGSFLFPSR